MGWRASCVGGDPYLVDKWARLKPDTDGRWISHKCSRRRWGSSSRPAHANHSSWAGRRGHTGCFVNARVPRWMKVKSAAPCGTYYSKLYSRSFFSPHCLRHSYASLMLQQAESLTCVQRHLGHASINLTADTYGEVGSHSEIKPLWTVWTLPWRLKVVAEWRRWRCGGGSECRSDWKIWWAV